MLSHAFWQRRFAGEAAVVGRSIVLDGASHTIAGVMPPSFAFPEADLDGWRILEMKPPRRRGPFYTWGIGRLLSAAGVAIGIAGALATTRLMAALLFGIAPSDPSTFVGIAAVLMATALAGSYLPARRATRIDPMTTLRAE